MKMIGLIGGMSWESTAIYYRLINEGVKARLGGHHSAKIILYSVDFAEIEHLQKSDRWIEAGQMLSEAARALQNAGADFIVLCTNTMHKVASAIESAITIPFLHIADPTAEAIKATGISTVGLLGTRFTMEQDFYVGRLRNRHQIKTIVPDTEDRNEVHRVIYEELVHGRILESSRRCFVDIVARLEQRGAHAIILGCTEIGMLFDQAHIDLKYFDSTKLHADMAVKFALVEQ